VASQSECSFGFSPILSITGHGNGGTGASLAELRRLGNAGSNPVNRPER
jgi:hypothetical protein